MDPQGYRRNLGRSHSIADLRSPTFRPEPQTLYHYTPSPVSPLEPLPPPLPPRPRPEGVGDMSGSAAVPDPLFSWRLRPRASVSGHSQRTDVRQHHHRSRRRPGVRLEDMDGREALSEYGRNLNVATLYPELSPYDDQLREYYGESAQRAVSQPNTPAFNELGPEATGDPTFLTARTPTYPPPSRRRGHGANASVETTFTDDDEFHLFAEATAGLDSLQAFSRNSMSASSFESDGRHQRSFGAESVGSQYLASPAEQTPTTMFALQQLAQMPQGSQAHRTSHMPHGGAQPWMQSSNLSHGFLGDEEDDELIDEELPDYAASQAQAHAAQRIEATRRAQELHRRWQESRYSAD